MEFVATSFLFSSFLISFIALIPKGVAAFDNPRAFAVILSAMFEKAGEFFGSSLKINFKIGDINFEIKLINPDFCAIFASPNQKAIMPIKPIET